MMNVRTYIGLLAVPAMVLTIPSCGERKREQARECHMLYVEYCKTWYSLKETAEKLDSLLTRLNNFFPEFDFSSVKYLPKWERDMLVDSIVQHTERLCSTLENPGMKVLVDRLFSENPGLKEKSVQFDEMVSQKIKTTDF